MADTYLTNLIRRLEQRDRFFHALMAELCDQCVTVLAENTPGTSLPDDWTYTVTRSPQGVTGHVFTKRLERTDENWELILTWLNYGTRSHFIAPVKAQALHWHDAGGNDHFSKGHIVSGILPANFVARCDRVVAVYMATLPAKWDAYLTHGTLP